VSRVYFHSEEGTAELLGCERAYASHLVTSIAIGLLNLHSISNTDRLASLVDRYHYINHYPAGSPGWRDAYGVAFTTSMADGLVTWRGKEIDTFSLALNTAMLVGSDQIRFLARLHGQCEIHGYVQGRNRAWLAGLIREGRASGLYRPGVGWEEVAGLLTSSDSGPVVMSYSVGSSFPSYRIALESGWIFPVKDDEREGFYDQLGKEAEWGMARKWLAKQPASLEICPGHGYSSLGRYRFGHGLTVLDLLAPDYADRLDRALGLVTN
jgi:hypothetical protein